MSRKHTKAKEASIKRYDTKISAIEKRYGIDLNVDGDTTLGKYFKEKGYPSLSKMLQNT